MCCTSVFTLSFTAYCVTRIMMPLLKKEKKENKINFGFGTYRTTAYIIQRSKQRSSILLWCKLSSLNDKLLRGPDLDNNAVGDLALASSKTCCHHVYQSHISIGQDSKWRFRLLKIPLMVWQRLVQRPWEVQNGCRYIRNDMQNQHSSTWN